MIAFRWTAACILGVMTVATPKAPAAEEAVFEVPCRDVTWEELTRTFDPRWIVPEPEGDNHLVARAQALADARWNSEDPRLRSFADLALAAGEAGSEAAVRELLDALRREQADAWAAWGEVLEQLLIDTRLRSSRWDPEDERDDDGVCMAPPWRLPRDAGEPWGSLEGSRDVHQGMVWMAADLASLKQGENDYATYPGYAGAEYESIFPVRDRHVRAAPGADAPEAVAQQIEFRVDIPFPFSTYTCRLAILSRLDGRRRLVTDVASTSDDFLWMAGRDVCVPVSTADGAPAGLLVVRWFGFDLEGVPDGDGARRSAIRGGLGRLKLRAEEARQRRGGELGALSGEVPRFTVRGDQRWIR